jgi:hypothetical protein
VVATRLSNHRTDGWCNLLHRIYTEYKAGASEAAPARDAANSFEVGRLLLVRPPLCQIKSAWIRPEKCC